jgi:hypothetical protein
MLIRFVTISLCISLVFKGYSQNITEDSTVSVKQSKKAIDPIYDFIDFDFDDLESFLDSLLTPDSYFLASVSLGKRYFNFTSKTDLFIKAAQKFTYTPTLGYYHHSGLGITANSFIVKDPRNVNVYQHAISPSYDYLKDKNLATGISLTKYFTKDSLPFYTTPLQNELYAYFTYRKWWLRPTVALSYGWGSRSDYQERQELITSLRLRLRGYTIINTKESVKDFSIVTSLRHDFYWLNVLARKDHIRFTPQLSLASGTQQFGFNMSSNSYATIVRTNSNVLFNSQNVALYDKIKFQPLSLTMYLRTEYSIGKFFIQPQIIFDYYLPASSNNFNTIGSLNAGFMF